MHRNGISKEERDLFDELIKIRKKANEFWIREVEIPTSSPDYLLDENGEFQEPELVVDVQDIVFDVIIKNAFSDANEL